METEDEIKAYAERKLKSAGSKIDKVAKKIDEKKLRGFMHKHPKPALKKELGKADSHIKKVEDDANHLKLNRNERLAFEEVRDNYIERKDNVEEKIDERKDTPVDKMVNAGKKIANRIPPSLPRIFKDDDDDT